MKGLITKARDFAAGWLKGHEPSVITTLCGLAAEAATHEGLDLTSAQQTWLSVGITAAVGLVIRSLVTPNSKVAVTKDELLTMNATPINGTVTAGQTTVTHYHTHYHGERLDEVVEVKEKVPAKKATPRKRARPRQE